MDAMATIKTEMEELIEETNITVVDSDHNLAAPPTAAHVTASSTTPPVDTDNIPTFLLEGNEVKMEAESGNSIFDPVTSTINLDELRDGGEHSVVLDSGIGGASGGAKKVASSSSPEDKKFATKSEVFRSMEIKDDTKTPYSDATQVCVEKKSFYHNNSPDLCER